MSNDKLTGSAFVILLGLFVVYAVLRNLIGLDFVSSLAVMLPLFSIAAFIYLKHQWREFFKCSEKLLMGLRAKADCVSSFFRRGEK